MGDSLLRYLQTIQRFFPFSLRDLLISLGILVCAVEVCSLLQMADSSDGFASPVFVLAVLLISRLTNGYLFGLIASLVSVVCVNFIFTYPYWAVNFTLLGYPLSFLTFLMVSIITSTLTPQAKQQERLRAENEILIPENLRFQCSIQRQDRPAEPLTADRERNRLRAGTGVAIVKEHTVPVLIVAALPADKSVCLIPLCRGHAVEEAARFAL